VIRAATPEDVPAVIRVYQESRAEAMPWLPDLHTMEEHLWWFGAVLGGEAWVYEEDGVLVGYAAMKDGELHDLYVAPEAQRRGVGSALFERVQAAYPGGFRFWVFRDNTRARAFYDARGCVVVDSSDGSNEEQLPDVQYEWLPSRAGAEG
jgi:ribosomal protein S18 acetylase RimI-like enzyme